MEQQAHVVRVRLQFADRRLLSKDQREKGLRRSWAVIRPEITTVAQFRQHIKTLFGLRCASADDLLLSMDEFVLPSFESTCMFTDNDLIRVETSQSKKKKIAITDGSHDKENTIVEKPIILSIDNGENSIHPNKRQIEYEKPESSKKKMKLTLHESSAVKNPVDSQNDGPINPVVLPSDNNKQIVVHADGSNEKNDRGPSVGNSILGPVPSHSMPGVGPRNWQAGQAKHNNSNFKRNSWKDINKGKNIVEIEEEESDDELDFENANVNDNNNWEAGGNKNTKSPWEVAEASNTRETQETESGWGTWPPSKKRTTSFRPQTGQNSNIGFVPHGGFSRRNTNRGGWETTQEAANGNEAGQTQTQENGWDTWAPSNSRVGVRRSSVGQNGNFVSRGGFSSRGRGRNGRGGKYNHSKFAN